MGEDGWGVVVLLWQYEERIKKHEWGMQQGTCLQVLGPCLHISALWNK